MTRRIVVGYADAPGGRDALALGVALADLDPTSELTVATVYAYNPPVETAPPTGWRKALRDTAEQQLESARERYGTRERTSFTACCGVSASDGLHRLAAELDATLLVVGVSHERGLGRVTTGSVTEQTLYGAPCAVAVAPSGFVDRPTGPPRTVAVAVNGSPESDRALASAAAVARAAGAGLRIVGVVEQAAVWYGGYAGVEGALEIRDDVRDQLERTARGVEGIDDVRVQVLEGDPARAIPQATSDVDLLVLGSRAHGPLRRVLLGSVSSRLIREPACPLLIVPRGATEHGDWSAAGDDAGGATA